MVFKEIFVTYIVKSVRVVDTKFLSVIFEITGIDFVFNFCFFPFT